MIHRDNATQFPDGFHTIWASGPFHQRLANFHWFAAWLGNRYGGTPTRSQGHPYHTRLIKAGVPCPAGCSKRPTHQFTPALPPEADHFGLWAIGGKAVAITSEPYWTVDDWSEHGTLARSQAWADAHGMEMHVFDRSWWAPEHGTILLVFTARPGLGYLPVLADEGAGPGGS